MQIKKALITAAGRSQRALPLQSLVDRDGEPKTALRIILDEAIASGVEEIGVVVAPADGPAFKNAAGPHGHRLRFFEQTEPNGFGHAVLAGRDFVGNAPFLLLVGDHLYVASESRTCARQLVEVATQHGCSVSAVQATHESKLPNYGAVGGRRLQGHPGLYEITEVLEKPTPTEAEQRLLVPGLRAGHYLCFFGMHVLTPGVMELLAEAAARTPGSRNLQLSPSLDELSRRERYLAFETRGRRYDLGGRFGLLNAQIALGLDGRHRDEVLAMMVDLLATREMGRTP